MEVIDGQHRIEAAKRLGLEVYYRVDDSNDSSIMFLLNTAQAKWTSEDYMNYYCAEGNTHYLQLRSFMSKNKLSLGLAKAAFGRAAMGTAQKDFKRGVFKYPGLEEELEAIQKLQHLKKLIEYIEPKILGHNSYLRGPSFSRCFTLFLNVKNVDFDTFMKKLPYKLDLIRPCARLADYLEIFRTIYNFKNQTPISKEDLKSLGDD